MNMWKDWEPSEREIMVRSCIANTLDDTIRLAYADWIDENQSKRTVVAEYIRDSVKVRRLNSIKEADRFMRECGLGTKGIWDWVIRTVTSVHANSEFRIPNKMFPRTISNDRGFLELSCTVECFMDVCEKTDLFSLVDCMTVLLPDRNPKQSGKNKSYWQKSSKTDYQHKPSKISQLGKTLNQTSLRAYDKNWIDYWTIFNYGIPDPIFDLMVMDESGGEKSVENMEFDNDRIISVLNLACCIYAIRSHELKEKLKWKEESVDGRY